MAAEALLSGVVHAEHQFAQVQHLAQADYGVLLHQLGKVEVCRPPGLCKRHGFQL